MFKKTLTLIITLVCLKSFAQTNLPINDENRYYKNVATSGQIKTLNISNVTDNKGDNDSNKLQTLINQVSNFVNPSNANKKGGIIKIPAGKYFFDNIIMKSNVHIKINKNVILAMGPVPDKNRNITMFNFGRDNDTQYTKNISITCDSNDSNDKFTVNFKTANYDSQKFIGCSRVENFLISGVKIIDNYTRLPAIGLSNAKTNNKFYRPRQGVVKNISSFKSIYGYGQVQMHAGKNILFKKLWGEGGVVLRLEPHFRENEPGQVLIDSIIARDIAGKNGNATVMLSPHRLDHGFLDIRNVRSNSSGFALRIEKGFSAIKDKTTGKVTKAYDSNGNEITGSFSAKSIFKNIKATYGNKAQLKKKHFNLIPCSLYNTSLIKKDENGERLERLQNGELSYVGPSIVAVLYRANYSFNNGIQNVVANNFSEQLNNGKIFNNNHNLYDCPNITIPTVTQNIKEIKTVLFKTPANSIYPTTVINTLNIDNKLGSNAYIFSTHGQLVKHFKIDNNNYRINTSFLNSGNFFINIINEKENLTKKFIKL